MNVFVFDIETIPDVAGGRRLYDLHDLDDQQTAAAMMALRREKTGSDFLPLHLQKIVAISAVLRQRDRVTVWSLGDLQSSEEDIIQRFFAGIDKYTPTLVSWNGCGFDLPVLHYRSLLHGISAPRYWETGDNDAQFKWNNYLNRYHNRHLDLMDVLASYQGRGNAPLDEIATLLGFPGKMGMSGSLVWDQYCQGNLSGIRDYCETDVLNTYLVFLRFEKIRGQLSESEYIRECQLLREMLAENPAPHLQEFLALWKED